MALDIIGYNATFDAFANFAKVQSDAGKQKAVARVDTSGAQGLAGRTIKAASGDWVGVGQGRLWTLKEADNAVNKVSTPPPNVMFYRVLRLPNELFPHEAHRI